MLDQKVGRKLDAAGKEIGVYKRIEVKVAPLGKGEPVQAITYQGLNVERYHIPPTQHYMDLRDPGGVQLRAVDDVDRLPAELQHAGGAKAPPARHGGCGASGCDDSSAPSHSGVNYTSAMTYFGGQNRGWGYRSSGSLGS